MTKTGAKSQMEAAEPDQQKILDPLKAQALRKIFVWNVLTLLLVGVAVYAWADYYTDHLPTIVTLLGGGGALAWLTTVKGVLTERRPEQLVSWIETAVFARRWFSIALLTLIIGLALGAMQFGGVEVQSLAGEPEHDVRIWLDGRKPPEGPENLAPGEHIRRLVWTPFALKRNVHIHVVGFPEKVVEVLPMKRVASYVPNSMRTPVVLIHPTIRLMEAARGPIALFNLEFDTKDQVGNAVHAVIPFDGQHSILIGGDEAIAIPPDTVDEWRAEADKRLDALRAWRAVVAPDEFAVGLAPGQTISLTLRPTQCPPDDPNIPPPVKCPEYNNPVIYKVKPLHGSQPYIQEVQLDSPPDKK